MNFRTSALLAITAFVIACLLGSAQSLAQNAYITNLDTVSVIDTATNTVTTNIAVGAFAIGVAVSPDGSKVYVTNGYSGSVSVIATATDSVIGSPIPVGLFPWGVAVTPDGSKVYVTNSSFTTVSVIATATDTVTTTVTVGTMPRGVAVTPDGSKVYVANQLSDSVSVIDTATNTVTATIPVGTEPFGVAVTPDGSKVYVTIASSGNVSVIATATDMVIGSPIPVGIDPLAFGVFIQPAKPAPRFAGTPGYSNCDGQSVSALAQQYRGLNAAAAALGFSDVSALQNAIMAFCE